MKEKQNAIMKIIVGIVIVGIVLVGGVEGAAGEMPYKDVKESEWYYGYVREVHERGLMNGISESKFAPGESMTRAMFVTVLSRMAEAETEGKGEWAAETFKDVKSGAWYAEAVGWAAEEGITDGYTDGTFKPEKAVNREEMSTLITRILRYMEIEVEEGEGKEFKDEGEISTWALECVKELSTTGIIEGDTAGNFNPKKEATRAEIAALATRLSEYIGSKNGEKSEAEIETEEIKGIIAEKCPSGRVKISGGYSATMTREFMNREIGRQLGVGEKYEVEMFPGDFERIVHEYSQVTEGGMVQRKFEIDVIGEKGGFVRMELLGMISKTPDKYYRNRMEEAGESLKEKGLVFRGEKIEEEELKEEIALGLEELAYGEAYNGEKFGTESEVKINGGIEEINREAEGGKGGEKIKKEVTYTIRAGGAEYDGVVPVKLRIPGETMETANFEYEEKVTVYVCDEEATYTDRLVEMLEEDCSEVRVVKGDRNNAGEEFSKEKSDIVIVVGASGAPRGIYEALEGYLSERGRVLLIGGQLYNGGSDTDKVIDTISPVYYETYPVTNGKTIRAEGNQRIVGEREYVMPEEIFSCVSYVKGTGYGNGKAFRQVPLLEIRDEKGLRAGYAGWLSIFSGTGRQNGAYEGSMIGCFSAKGNEFYNEAGLKAVIETVEYMLKEVRLIEGGSDNYTYFGDTEEIEIEYGYVCEYGIEDLGEVTIKAELRVGERVIDSYSENLSEKYGKAKQLIDKSEKYRVTGERPDRVEIKLYIDGIESDSIGHEIGYYTPKDESERKYIYSEGGDLMRDGEKITLYGVNYMPSNGKADESGIVHAYCFSEWAYDPDIIYNDLLRIKDIGFNAVSVFAMNMADPAYTKNIVHFLSLCEELELYVDIELIAKDNPETAHKIAERYRWSEFDIISAYDICWEGRLGNYEGTGYANLGRKRFDPQWREWLAVQYGSIEAAEKIFGVPLPRDAEGNVIGVQDATLDSGDAANLKMVAVYRRFIDDAVAEYWNDIAQGILEYDTNHLIGFRMTSLGKGSEYMYDFRSLVPSLTVMEPEGYILDGTESSCLQAVFCNLYARYCNPDVPVIWKEFGRSVWSGSNYKYDEGLHESTESLYRYALDAMYKGYSSGVYCWYFYGGYRFDEKSDYGILNMDGSDRLSTGVLREYAEKFKSMGRTPKADFYIEVDRDDYNSGTLGMYEKTVGEIKEALDNGKNIKLVNKAETGGKTIYADEVSDIRLTGETSVEGPLKYVNGMVKKISVKEEGEKTYADLTIVNTQDAVWKKGTVSIVSVDGKETYAVIDSELERADETVIRIDITGKSDVAVRFRVNGVLFGNKYSIS